MSESRKVAFEDAAKEHDASLIAELLQMLRQNKKYWMAPLIIVLLAFGALIALGGTAAAPFIYQLF
jgi:hypothetical protein